MNIRKSCRWLWVALCAVVIASPVARAAYAPLVFTMQEVNGDVVLTTEGGIWKLAANDNDDLISARPTRVYPDQGNLIVNGAADLQFARYKFALTGPIGFGFGTGGDATSTTGFRQIGFDMVDEGADDNALFLAVGDAGLSGFLDFTGSGATWAGTTLSELGAAPGTYVWSLDSRFAAPFNTITLNVVAVPEAKGWMMGGALAGIFAITAWLRRRQAQNQPQSPPPVC